MLADAHYLRPHSPAFKDSDIESSICASGWNGAVSPTRAKSVAVKAAWRPPNRGPSTPSSPAKAAQPASSSAKLPEPSSPLKRQSKRGRPLHKARTGVKGKDASVQAPDTDEDMQEVETKIHVLQHKVQVTEEYSHPAYMSL